MHLSNQKIIILGASKSGLAVGEYLSKHQLKFYFFEELKIPKAVENIEKMIELGGQKISIEQDEILSNVSFAVISPGLPINHPIAVKLKKFNKPIISELEFGFEILKPTVVAITGTNGKTTTSTLIYEILKENQSQTLVMGNIGEAVTGFADQINQDTICVTEVSSFQLESIHRFCPYISCVLNISPDHLERHYTMENYIFLKKKILRNLNSSEYAILNYDDQVVRTFSEGVRAKVLWISTQTECQGVYIKNGKVFYLGIEVCDSTQIPTLSGKGIYNFLFAIAVCKVLGLSNDVIKIGLTNFHGIKHRMEMVAEVKGVRYYNDSKATNTASTISAIENLNSPTVLILGGSEKGEKYDLLFEKIKINPFIKHSVITGASRLNMLESCTKAQVQNVTITDNFECAVRIAQLIAKDGDNVLLSPGCASFDSFSSFEERGELFCKLIGDGNEC